MDRENVLQSQMLKLEDKVYEAQLKGRSFIICSPICEENIDEVKKDGLEICRIQLKDTPMQLDIVYWSRKMVPYDSEKITCMAPQFDKKEVSSEEFNILLKMKEMEL